MAFLPKFIGIMTVAAISLLCFSCTPNLKQITYNNNTITIDDNNVNFSTPIGGTYILVQNGSIVSISDEPIDLRTYNQDILWINDENTIIALAYNSFMYDYGLGTRTAVGYACVKARNNNKYIVTKTHTIRQSISGIDYTPCNSNFIVNKDGWGTPKVDPGKLLDAITSTNLFERLDEFRKTRVSVKKRQ